MVNLHSDGLKEQPLVKGKEADALTFYLRLEFSFRCATHAGRHGIEGRKQLEQHSLRLWSMPIGDPRQGCGLKNWEDLFDPQDLLGPTGKSCCLF